MAGKWKKKTLTKPKVDIENHVVFMKIDDIIYIAVFCLLWYLLDNFHVCLQFLDILAMFTTEENVEGMSDKEAVS